MNLRLTTCGGVGPFPNTRKWSHGFPPDSAPLALRRPKNSVPLAAGENEWLTSVHETRSLEVHWMAPSRIEAP